MTLEENKESRRVYGIAVKTQYKVCWEWSRRTEPGKYVLDVDSHTQYKTKWHIYIHVITGRKTPKTVAFSLFKHI